MPKFEAEYDIEMSDIMKSLGVVRAFDEGEAEFKGIGTSDSGAPVDEIKEVYLVRPFIYLLMDCETDVPLFIGVMRET